MISAKLIVKEEDAFEQKSKKIRYYLRAVKPLDPIPLTARQKEAYDIIRESGDLELQEFKVRFKGSNSILMKLLNYKVVESIKKNTFRTPSWEGLDDWNDGPPDLLTEDQKAALQEISAALSSGKFTPFLLHGVTGSGKTEVYFRPLKRRWPGANRQSCSFQKSPSPPSQWLISSRAFPFPWRSCTAVFLPGNGMTNGGG